MRRRSVAAGGTTPVRVQRMLLLGAALGMLAACRPGLEEDRVEGLRHLSGVVKAKGTGIGSAKLRLEPGETAMLVTGRSAAPHRTHVRRLVDASGQVPYQAQDHLDTTRSKTNAAFVSEVVSLGWPIVGDDPGLSPGRWEVALALADASNGWVPGEVELDVLLKEDDDFTRGTVHASVIFAGGIEQDPELVRGAEEALEVWADLYARYGLELAWDLSTYPSGDLYPPGLGSADEYLALTAATPLRSVRVVISDTIREYPDVYGMAGDIPGPLVASPKSAVLVSAQLAAGPDGVFSAEEVRMFGETLAHEAGHFLGLFHPVELDYDQWDALDDTPECTSQQSCVGQLAHNLMFPFPVCSFVGCTPQEELTPMQTEVVHRHVVVD